MGEVIHLVPLTTLARPGFSQKVASLNVVLKEAVRDAVNRTTEKYETDRAQLTGKRAKNDLILRWDRR